MITIKRVYEEPRHEDGLRVLVDRLWPRGLAKEEARVDEWLKEIAPTEELRKWFGHDPEKWEEFRRRYREELHSHGDLLEGLRSQGKKGTVTLVYAAKDAEHNNAMVLQELLSR